MAKLDRLAGNVAFLATLMESRVRCQAAQSGTPANLAQVAHEKSWATMTHNAQENLHNRQAAQLARLLRATGATLRAITKQLN